MPLYEFACRACSHQFESLVRAGEHPTACPSCGSADLERLLSNFGVKTAATTTAAVNKAKAARSRAQRDQVIAEQQHAEHHDH